jgi:hypothetical protein
MIDDACFMRRYEESEMNESLAYIDANFKVMMRNWKRRYFAFKQCH